MNYQIKVRGNVDASWSDWFDGMEISSETGRESGCATTFTGPVDDQATLRGILSRLWDLNLVVLSVNQIDPKA